MRTLEDLVPMEELMKVRKKMRVIRHHVRFTRFVITSTVEETTFDSDEATFEVEQTWFEVEQTWFVTEQTFFTTEQVTSVAEEIIGEVPVMSLSTINKQTEGEKTHDPHPLFSRIRISKRSGTYGNHRCGSQRTARQQSVLEPAP